MIPKKEWNSLKRSHKHKETAFVSAYINSPCYHFITRFLLSLQNDNVIVLQSENVTPPYNLIYYPLNK